MPTLFVWGKQDKIIPEAQSATWTKLVKGSKLKTFSPAGHLVMNEKPEAVKAIAEFLGGLSGSRTAARNGAATPRRSHLGDCDAGQNSERLSGDARIWAARSASIATCWA